jgi:putative membrane protein
MKKLLMAAALSASALTMMAQTGMAQDTTKPMQAATTANESDTTQAFVTKAANSNMFEIQSSQLAEKKSKNQDIKQLAQMLVADHKKLGSQFKSVVKESKAKAPQTLDADAANKLSQLKTAAGTDFDRVYLQDQLDGHQEAVDLFTAYSENGDNPALKSWASKTLPTLKEHLQKAEAIKLPQTTGSL